MLYELNADSGSEFVECATKRWKASTPEFEHDRPTMTTPSPISGNSDLSFESTVDEFPIDGACVDRTIEIGSSGEEQQMSSESDSEAVFPSDNEADGESSDDGAMFPSDVDSEQKNNSAESMSFGNAADVNVQSELTDVGSTLVSGCCQQQCLLSLTPSIVISSRRKLNTLTSSERRQ